MLWKVVSLHKEDVLGSQACHRHLSELHMARVMRIRNGVEKVNSRWAGERASVGSEVQWPPLRSGVD